MDIPTVPGSLYTVATKTTCDITDTATGTPIDSASAGSVTFTAQGNLTTLSDPDATYARVNFKDAAAALRLLGGGLPSGYIEAEFLESTGSQYIDTGYVLNNKSRVYCRYFVKNASVSGERVWGSYVSGGSNSFAYWHSPRGNIFFVYGGYNSSVGGGNSRGGVFEIYANAVQWELTGPRTVSKIFEPQVFETFSTAYLFTYKYKDQAFSSNFKGRIYAFKIENELLYKPAISPDGEACMFDTVTKQTFFNSGSGSFIVGLTLTQARKLGKLPPGGGELKISLPENYIDDVAVVEALSTATENGWAFEIQTYTTDGAEASTFALRRIWVKKTADPAGAYVDATGARWHVEWCQTVIGAEPTDLGYEPFRSVAVALAEWELTPFIYPEEETLSI